MRGLLGGGRGGGEDQPVWMLSCVSCGRVWGSLMSGCARDCGLTSRLTHLLSSTSWMLHLEWWANKGTIFYFNVYKQTGGLDTPCLISRKINFGGAVSPTLTVLPGQELLNKIKTNQNGQEGKNHQSHRPSLIIVIPTTYTTTHQPKGSRL